MIEPKISWSLCYIRKCVMSNLQSLELDLVNINVYAIFYQNIPDGSSLRTSFTSSEFDLSKASTNSECHLAIP